MKIVNAVLLVVVVVMLGVVAYDLHRVANVLETTTGVTTNGVALTREQQRTQTQRMVREGDALLDDIASTPQTTRRTPSKPR